MKKEAFKPSEYLKTRRPENYSDSVIIEQPQLTKSILEYHLETLTNRGEENEFQYFARQLAEQELAPNLLPQTGPTGGGDSKVDTETYPVSQSISERWYQHIDNSAKEKWAFAISAKKDWRAKVKSDVKKIIETKRGYNLIYFISNQYIPDKKRAEVEDALTKEFTIQVRILDRSWIVEKILNNNRLQLAFQTLKIDGSSIKETRKIGPNDASREVELQILDENISDSKRYLGVEYQLAEDGLQGAIIACQLDRPRQEIDGRFSQAIRISEKYGNQRQLLRILYRQAWSICFYFDDVEETSKLYDNIEKIALESDYTDDIEYLSNLWCALLGCVKFDQITSENAKLIERSSKIQKKLKEISSDTRRPNNAHSAKALLCIHELALCALDNNKLLDNIFIELQTILSSSETFGAFPFESYAEIILELGEFIPDNKAYESLFDSILQIKEKRTSEGEAGVILLNRAIQKLKGKKPYDAIRFLGKAQEKLIKEEYREELIKSLVACGAAYKLSGLFWAARSNILSALSLLINEFGKSGYMAPLALSATKELSWIETHLGRIPHILFSLILSDFVFSNSSPDEQQQESYFSHRIHVDKVLSILFIKSNYSQLNQLLFLPKTLEKSGLHASQLSLLFALGDFDKIVKEEMFGEKADFSMIEKSFENVSKHPAYNELPEQPNLLSDTNVQLKSKVLGCEIRLYSSANPLSILIGETLLGAIESFLATSLALEIIPYRSFINVNINTTEEIEDKSKVSLSFNEQNVEINVSHSSMFNLDAQQSIEDFKDVIHQFIATILPHIAIFPDIETYFQRLVKEENVFGRSLNFSDLITVSNNVFGNLEWMQLSHWNSQESAKLERKDQWLPPVDKSTTPKSEPIKRGKGPPPEHMLDHEAIKHTDRKIASIIDIPLWNKAKWSGSFFMIYPKGMFPPCLGLLFKDEESARSIFEKWKKELTNEDKNDAIRVSIITGIDKNNPHYYRVHVGSNIEIFQPKAGEQLLMVSRINTMTPDTSKNLDMFLKEYADYKFYCLIPAIMIEGDQPKVLNDLGILKQKIHVRSAWEIGDNDDDFAVIQEDDDPIIPENIKDPPILNAIRRKKSRLKR